MSCLLFMKKQYSLFLFFPRPLSYFPSPCFLLCFRNRYGALAFRRQIMKVLCGRSAFQRLQFVWEGEDDRSFMTLMRYGWHGLFLVLFSNFPLFCNDIFGASISLLFLVIWARTLNHHCSLTSMGPCGFDSRLQLPWAHWFSLSILVDRFWSILIHIPFSSLISCLGFHVSYSQNCTQGRVHRLFSRAYTEKVVSCLSTSMLNYLFPIPNLWQLLVSKIVRMDMRSTW